MELELARPILQRICICRSQAFEDRLEAVMGLRRLRERLLPFAAPIGALLASLLAMKAAAEGATGLCVGLILLAAAFGCVFVARLGWGTDLVENMVKRHSDSIRQSFTIPQIRRNVDRAIDRTVKHAPFTVHYHFGDDSYSAKAPNLKLDRTIRAAKIKVAYEAESVFCLFKGVMPIWHAIVYVESDEHRKIVREFLLGNKIELQQLNSEALE
ncbi:MAG: hypothetical protein WD875_11045 [Pirellulales bacterium]